MTLRLPEQCYVGNNFMLETFANHFISLDFSYDIIFPPDRMWGSLVNGVWNGFPRQLQTKVSINRPLIFLFPRGLTICVSFICTVFLSP